MRRFNSRNERCCREGRRGDTPYAPRARDGRCVLMRTLKYHVASSIDGFIAHEDHTVDGFLAEGEHVTDYLAALKTDYDVVLMGRKTYEFGLQYGVTSPYPWLKQYVLSRSMERSPDSQVELVSDNIL